MRRRAIVIVVSWALGCTWLGCNALLGNESAVFEADGGSSNGEGGSVDAALDEASRSDAPSDPDASPVHPCNDTQTDPFNCGSCGHDCFGGACNAGRCAPVVLATDPGEPAEIAVDATHVYWTNAKTGDVRRAPIAGGAAETIYDGPTGTMLAEGLVRVGADVYFALEEEDGGVFRCPATGCGAAGPQPVIAPMNSPGSLALAASGELLVSESMVGGRVGRCTLPCAAGLTFVTGGEGFPRFVAAEGEGLYWSTLIPVPGNLRGKVDNASAETTLTSAQTVQQVAVNGSEVVFAVRGSGVKGVPRGGGAVRRIFEPLTQTERVALDGDGVYFNDTKITTGRILRCPLVGCGDAGITVASLQASPNAIVVDKTSVYWTNRGDGNVGTVMRLAK
jgi:hypothetical protein